jgi:hypothetical protein
MLSSLIARWSQEENALWMALGITIQSKNLITRRKIMFAAGWLHYDSVRIYTATAA